MKSNVLEFLLPETSGKHAMPFAQSPISAGFPSPAEDFQEERISLDKYVVKNSDATFYAQLKGNSMIEAGFDEGDILVIDRSLEPTDNKIAICQVDGDFTCKKIKINESGAWLIPYNSAYKPIRITEENQFMVWGIVTHIVKKVS